MSKVIDIADIANEGLDVQLESLCTIANDYTFVSDGGYFMDAGSFEMVLRARGILELLASNGYCYDIIGDFNVVFCWKVDATGRRCDRRVISLKLIN